MLVILFTADAVYSCLEVTYTSWELL